MTFSERDIDDIVLDMSHVFGVSPELVLGSRKNKTLGLVRCVIAKQCIDAGATRSEIAHYFRVSETTITKRLKRFTKERKNHDTP